MKAKDLRPDAASDAVAKSMSPTQLVLKMFDEVSCHCVVDFDITTNCDTTTTSKREM